MTQKLNVAELRLRSPAFEHHKRIPDRYSGDGEDLSPELQWTGVPEGTRAFAVVVHDPDAPLVDGFTHWVAYGLSGDARGVREGGGDGLIQGLNSFGNTGYNGPAPPPDHGTHHYYFWVYALDEELALEPGLGRRALLETIEDHVIEQARLVGTFSH
ncbi:MAG: YbhB/YbcL family Raf kinase inhibitor-like protein [Solirubrobacteraceae bacterium]